MVWAVFVLLPAVPIVAQETTPPAGFPLPLAAAIARVHAVAPQRRAAQARIQAAEGSVRQANRLPNPSLDLHQENLGAGSPLDQTLDVFATLSQPLEIGGKRAARTAVAAAEVQLAHATARQAERDLTLETVRLYLAALQTSTLMEFLSSNRDELQVLVTVMTRRVEEGYVAEADLEILAAQAQLDRARHALVLEKAKRLPNPAFTAGYKRTGGTDTL